MRIVHFSDIHVGCIPRSLSSLFDKRIFGVCNYYLRRRGVFDMDILERALPATRELKPDLVVCTGDITSTGSPREFRLATDLLRPFVDTHGKRFVYLPGNHDTYVRDPRCRRALDEAFGELNGGRWSLDQLPVAISAGKLRLILLHEAVPTAPWSSSGRINTEALARLMPMLEQPRTPGQLRILVGHFPLRNRRGLPLGRRRGLLQADQIYQALRDGQLDASLCGHDHSPYVRTEESGAMEICAGSLTIHGRINVLDTTDQDPGLTQWWADVA